MEAAKFRNRCIAQGLEDNMGAIHSAERALHLLGPKLVYPGMGHLNNFRKYGKAVFSAEALKAYAAGGKVQIEHVQPHRALTLQAIEKANEGDEALRAFVKKRFRLALLTPEETRHLNKVNRSRIDPARLRKAGIALASHAEADRVLSRGRAREKLPSKGKSRA